ncbi:3-hydroxyacyl-CoA dehydrogenase family protein [Micrococcus luteus]|uniref:3-hydroxyacyl-CoA dehydrogenase family protein n=1 Tax=Micrococcus TaxID=1269 RepID=UPI0019D205C3|nr:MULTISPECIES: 3-hydroxyacyl-CoA dehydrogenase family protein [Micrococcus]MBY0173868.1 3-hydroxyacyl-CoA dehydrogenase family protein [Micrococcus luteus]MCD0181255.1 3-hydroxyacyl-CoA dehydrogenase family protein [Micrococcus luteus]MCT2066105.1 3-hydroxyacyl-CoA dehydrogenase family protein [Micrococcus luteus]MCV7543068.1 3-hydroxyacyl-CoA dehydrogenase family protein [Micrococcus luteus]MCV7591140.1 3-hydroxyacyl-CoA dehydrogenase family protein [Micrococcus luteus]
MTEEIRSVVVLGAGTMGSQIAAVSALAGYTTSLVDIQQKQLDRAREQLRQRLDRDVEKGRRDRGAVDEAWGRLALTTDRDRVAASADLVIEAAVEDLSVKRSIFADLDRVCPPHTLLVTNSSNIVSSRVADATGRPGKVCNLHFFNPALVMACVEIVPHEGTDPETVEAASAFVRSLGKTPVKLKREVPGFLANRLLNALRREALDLYEGGVADFEDIDLAAKTALGHPMGPFELMDLVGIDVVYLIRLAEYEQTGDPASLPADSIKAKYEAGDYGRKTGRGWYDYSKA